MNDRQRDLFLWLWSRRRLPGRAAIALRGAGIGALGGVLFGLIMAPGTSLPGVHAYDAAGQLASDARLFALAIAAFGLIGWVLADRIWSAQETTYQSMLKAGAQVPAQKPALALADRGPALAVAVVAALVAGFILSLLWMFTGEF